MNGSREGEKGEQLVTLIFQLFKELASHHQKQPQQEQLQQEQEQRENDLCSLLSSLKSDEQHLLEEMRDKEGNNIIFLACLARSLPTLKNLHHLSFSFTTPLPPLHHQPLHLSSSLGSLSLVLFLLDVVGVGVSSCYSSSNLRPLDLAWRGWWENEKKGEREREREGEREGEGEGEGEGEREGEWGEIMRVLKEAEEREEKEREKGEGRVWEDMFEGLERGEMEERREEEEKEEEEEEEEEEGVEKGNFGGLDKGVKFGILEGVVGEEVRERLVKELYKLRTSSSLKKMCFSSLSSSPLASSLSPSSFIPLLSPSLNVTYGLTLTHSSILSSFHSFLSTLTHRPVTFEKTSPSSQTTTPTNTTMTNTTNTTTTTTTTTLGGVFERLVGEKMENFFIDQLFIIFAAEKEREIEEERKRGVGGKGKEEGGEQARHTDDSDVTINFCVETVDLVGGELEFFPFPIPPSLPSSSSFPFSSFPSLSSSSCFSSPSPLSSSLVRMVGQRENCLVIHKGSLHHQVHKTTKGKRTNVLLWLKKKK